METFIEDKELYLKMVHERGKEKEVPIRRWEPEAEIEYLN
jgi:hypothetical protein